MVEPHPLPLSHCKGLAPAQAEVQLLSPACKTSLPHRAQLVPPRRSCSRAGQPCTASCAGTARFLAATSLLQEGTQLWATPVRVREAPAFWVQLLARENIPGSSLEETFPVFSISWGHGFGLVRRPSPLACRGLKAHAITPETS